MDDFSGVKLPVIGKDSYNDEEIYEANEVLRKLENKDQLTKE